MSSQGECELDPSEDCQQYDKENPYVGSQVSPTDRVDSYTDTEQEFEISGAHFQKIASNIIEICNEDLPADPKERRREQEKRRRYKDKISSEQYESIIVEYSEINSAKEYTGATLTSRYLTRWEEIISDFYSTKYTVVNKNIPYGKQTMLLNDNEDKVLIFSCYPSTKKTLPPPWISNGPSLKAAQTKSALFIKKHGLKMSIILIHTSSIGQRFLPSCNICFKLEYNPLVS